MPQLNIRVDRGHLDVVRNVTKAYRTSVSQLFRGYVEYLSQGGKPLGYPQTDSATTRVDEQESDAGGETP